MRGHRRFGILLAVLAVFLLLPLSGRPVKADTSALELYVPQETEEQQEHREDGTSAPQTSDETGGALAPVLTAVLAGAAAAGLTAGKKRKASE